MAAETKDVKETTEVPLQEKLDELRRVMVTDSEAITPALTALIHGQQRAYASLKAAGPTASADADAVSTMQAELIKVQQRALKSTQDYYELAIKYLLFANRGLSAELEKLKGKKDTTPEAPREVVREVVRTT